MAEANLGTNLVLLLFWICQFFPHITWNADVQCKAKFFTLTFSWLFFYFFCQVPKEYLALFVLVFDVANSWKLRRAHGNNNMLSLPLFFCRCVTFRSFFEGKGDQGNNLILCTCTNPSASYGRREQFRLEQPLPFKSTIGHEKKTRWETRLYCTFLPFIHRQRCEAFILGRLLYCNRDRVLALPKKHSRKTGERGSN